MEDNDVIQYAPVSVFEWVISLLVLSIPLLNIIMLMVWAFSNDINPTKSNFAKAALIWMLVGILLSLLFITSILSITSSFMDVFDSINV